MFMDVKLFFRSGYEYTLYNVKDFYFDFDSHLIFSYDDVIDHDTVVIPCCLSSFTVSIQLDDDAVF